MTAHSDDLLERAAERARRRWNESTADMLAGPATTPSAAADVIEGALDRLAALEDAPATFPVDSLPARPRSRPLDRWVVIAAAAAAAILLVWISRPAAQVLPRYVEDGFEGGIKHVRGDAPRSDAPIVLLPASSIRWGFVPATATDTPVGVRIEAIGPARHCVSPGGTRVSPSGAVELSGPASTVLGLPAGEYALTVLVGAKDRLDELSELSDACARDSDGARPRGVAEVVTRSVQIRGEP